MPPLEIENLDHLGLVAGMIDELGLVELTNEEIEPHCLEHVSAATAKPTFRWIMQKFQGIHWINLEGQRQVSNLSDERGLIIRLLGPLVERYYYPSG